MLTSFRAVPLGQSVSDVAGHLSYLFLSDGVFEPPVPVALTAGAPRQIHLLSSAEQQAKSHVFSALTIK